MTSVYFLSIANNYRLQVFLHTAIKVKTKVFFTTPENESTIKQQQPIRYEKAV